MRFIKNSAAYLLGLIYVVFSVQFFVMVLTHAAMPPMSELANEFMHVFLASGLMFVVKGIELTGGVLLFVPRTRALVALVLAPISTAIVLTELLVVQPPVVEMIPALLVLILNIVIIYQNRAKYLPIIAR